MYGRDSLESAKTMALIAGLFMQTGSPEDAVDCCTTVLKIRKEKLSPNHYLIAQALSNLALAMDAVG